MKVTKARMENRRSVRFLELVPTSTLVKILGRNGTGKTSVLEGLIAPVLSAKVQGDDTTHGEKKGSDVVEFEHGGKRYRSTVTRKRGKSPQCEVVEIDADGERIGKVPAPREFLAQMVGRMHDVREILRVTTPEMERRMRDTLLEAAGVSVSDLDLAEKQARERRRVLGRDMEDAEAVRSKLRPPRADLPAEPVSMAGLLADIDKMQRRREAQREAELCIDDLAAEQERLKAHADELEATIERLRAEAAADRARATAIDDEIAAVEVPDAPEPEEIEAAKAKLGEVEGLNESIREGAAWREADENVRRLREAHEAADAEVAAAMIQRVERLAAAEMPIEGLSVDEEGVAYNGERLANLSTGQKLVVGAAIAVATRKDFDALFCDGAESLDDLSEAALAALCEAHGVTAFLTQTTREGGSLVIEGAEYSVGA